MYIPEITVNHYDAVSRYVPYLWLSSCESPQRKTKFHTLLKFNLLHLNFGKGK